MTIPPTIDKAGLKQLEKALLSTSPEQAATWVYAMESSIKEVFGEKAFGDLVAKHYKDTRNHHVAFGMLLGILYTKIQVSIVKGILDGSIEIED